MYVRTSKVRQEKTKRMMKGPGNDELRSLRFVTYHCPITFISNDIMYTIRLMNHQTNGIHELTQLCKPLGND